MPVSEQEKMIIAGEVVKAMSRREKAEKVERFRHLNAFAKKGQIVFAGSSLMEQFPIYEFLLDFDLPYTIYNRGIGGYTTDELLGSMEECIYALEPRAIFLNIGTNDLNGPDYTLSGLMANYERIVCGIRERLPETKLYLLAYYPVNPGAAKDPYMAAVFRHRTNERIREANEAVSAMAARMGAAFHDLNAPITDKDGNLRAEYTVEGMHMYADGYEKVLAEMKQLLSEAAGK